jgi:hypothetical protein
MTSSSSVIRSVPYWRTGPASALSSHRFHPLRRGPSFRHIGHNYQIRLRLWLNKGDAVRWKTAWGPVGRARLDDNGETLVTEVRIDRQSLVSGLFYGIEGMRVGDAPAGDRSSPGVRRARSPGRDSCRRQDHGGNHHHRTARAGGVIGWHSRDPSRKSSINTSSSSTPSITT